MNFEQLLISKGYKKYIRTKDNNLVEATENDILSTLGNIHFIYTRDVNDINDYFYWGLSEYQKPPTLAYPRPLKECNSLLSGKRLLPISDDEMNRILLNEDLELLYETLQNNRKRQLNFIIQ